MYGWQVWLQVKSLGFKVKVSDTWCLCGDELRGLRVVTEEGRSLCLGLRELHVPGLRKLGVEAVEVRKAEQLEGLAGLIIPGGESTTMAKLAEHYHLVSHNLTLKSKFSPLSENPKS